MRAVELVHDTDHPAADSNFDLFIRARVESQTMRMKAYKGEFPAFSDFDLLVLHGGSQHLWDKGADPWLAREVAFVRKALEHGKPVIGFCLGGQILAEALSVPVTGRMRRKPDSIRCACIRMGTRCSQEGLKIPSPPSSGTATITRFPAAALRRLIPGPPPIRFFAAAACPPSAISSTRNTPKKSSVNGCGCLGISAGVARAARAAVKNLCACWSGGRKPMRCLRH